MACYHPLTGIWLGEYTDSGKKKYKIAKKADLIEEQKFNECVQIPCGKCIGCRLDYSRRWADRMMLELETQKKAVFLTLTYRDAQAHPIEYAEFAPPEYFPAKPNEIIEGDRYYLPVSWNLEYRDIQLFLKRLRKYVEPLKLRFYCAGEYG